MKSVYAYLNGGLGNQMFQYAAARSYSLHTNSALILDNWSGFIRDNLYKRSYELNNFPIQARVAAAFERLPIWLYRIENRLLPRCSNPIQKKIYGSFLVETELRFLNEFFYFNTFDNLWINGYWQSELYFSQYKNIIFSELMPPTPKQNKFIELGHQLRLSESVAVGIRLYEESTNPAAHARGGSIKDIKEVKTVINNFLNLNPSAKFFIFCTHRMPILNELNMPSDTVFVTPEDGFHGTTDKLWLLTQAKHHIFTNSTFYWWGAWLSQFFNNNKPQNIIAADNFINVDSICQNWQSF